MPARSSWATACSELDALRTPPAARASYLRSVSIAKPADPLGTQRRQRLPAQRRRRRYRLDNRGTYASPSPVTDGETVVFFYGNGDLVGFNMKGDKLWARNIQKDYGDFPFSGPSPPRPHSMKTSFTCPCCSATNPCTVRQGEQPSFILAMEPKTGKTL